MNAHYHLVATSLLSVSNNCYTAEYSHSQKVTKASLVRVVSVPLRPWVSEGKCSCTVTRTV